MSKVHHCRRLQAVTICSLQREDIAQGEVSQWNCRSLPRERMDVRRTCFGLAENCVGEPTVWPVATEGFARPRQFSGPPHRPGEIPARRNFNVLAVIPTGMTSILQPLDVSVNRRFKAKFRRCYSERMAADIQRGRLLEG